MRTLRWLLTLGFLGTALWAANVSGQIRPTPGSGNVSNATGTLAATHGGTGFTGYTVGDLVYASTTTALSKLTDVAAGSYLRSGGTSTAPVWSTVTLPNTVAAGNALYASATNVLSAATPGSLGPTFPANQTGNSTATLKMNGLGAAGAPCVVTPATSGRVLFTITGQIVQSTTADGIAWAMYEGTGAAPANAAAAAGTQLTALQTHTALTGALEETFTTTAVKTGLSLVATWFDLQVAEVTGGTASITNVTCSALEF